MKLSQKKFERLLHKNQLTLSFIGMSNIGKTYWSRKLMELNFKHFDCDEIIKAKLVALLKVKWKEGLSDVSHWMGQPYDQRFIVNQQKYLELEKEVMEKIFLNLKNIKKQNVVIGVTGSVVHLDSAICKELKKRALVIYIQETDSMRKNMFENYIKKPKPVVFGNLFRPRKGETQRQALERSYKNLLDKRRRLYTKYADITIPRESIGQDISASEFISLIKEKL